MPRLRGLEPVELSVDDLLDAAEGIDQILETVVLGELDLCPPLIAILVRVSDAIARVLAHADSGNGAGA